MKNGARDWRGCGPTFLPRFKLCLSLVQVTANVTQVQTTQMNPASASFNEFWGVADGGCYLDTSGCINSPTYPIVHLANGTCEIHITGSSDGDFLMFADFETEEKFEWLCAKGVGYSGEPLDFVDELQGMEPTTRILWFADDGTEEQGWIICRENRG